MNAVLAQVQNGSERVICYASKSFSKDQCRYSTTKRELLVIVNFKTFQALLVRKEVPNCHRSDSLAVASTFKDPDGLTVRWFEKLAAFEYGTVHRSEKTLDTRTQCPGFPVKTPPRTRRMPLCAGQKQSTQRTITTKPVTQNGQTVLARAREKTSNLPEEANEAKIAAAASLYAR